jgi:hypothetical protein
MMNGSPFGAITWAIWSSERDQTAPKSLDCGTGLELSPISVSRQDGSSTVRPVYICVVYISWVIDLRQQSRGPCVC